MIIAVAFLAAAAAGALARAEITWRLNRPQGFALGTLLVNVTGSFLLGLLQNLGPPALTLLGVGALGAFTTFSGLARDSVALMQAKRIGLALIYVGLSLSLGILAAVTGLAIAGG